MPRLSIRLLGLFEVLLDEEPVTGFDSDKVRALLAYLAVEADHPHRREKLAGFLWPDYPERSARTSLRRALTNLRQVIGDKQAAPPFLYISPQAIQLNRTANCWVDVAAFTEASVASQPAIPNLEEAISLYRGNFLDGFSIPDSSAFEDWITLTRESSLRELINAHHRLLDRYLVVGNTERALVHLRKMVELDPYDEEANAQLIQLLGANGRRSEALSVYESLRRSLSKEFDAVPASATTAIYEKIRSGDFIGSPVAVTSPSVATLAPPG
ncbi:MAG: BTAD domain-containing putative transcriptional regulator, partial [Anaerolineales bacterium]|nr:BTAD domain-containing putative transcriptional regulator [Anaerolineales bacterium]